MIGFEDREAVEEWLARLNYEEFWHGVEDLDLDLPSRADCENGIAGEEDRRTVLVILKGLARLQIVQEQRLKPRITARRLH